MTNVTIDHIPEILRPRLWRPFVMFPKGSAPVLYGPGKMSSIEALHWIDKASRSGQYRGRGWRGAMRGVALSGPISLLDAEPVEAERIRKSYRKKAIETALSGSVQGNGPASIYDVVLKALPNEAAVLESIGRRAPSVTRTQNARSAAAALIGLGLPMQKILMRRTWPEPWEFPMISKNENGLAVAGVLDWRNLAGRGRAWPKLSDPVGKTFERRLWRAQRQAIERLTIKSRQRERSESTNE